MDENANGLVVDAIGGSSYSASVLEAAILGVLPIVVIALLWVGIRGIRRGQDPTTRLAAKGAVVAASIILLTIALGMLMPVVFLLLMFEFALFGTLFWVWMLIDCVTNESNIGNDKLIWVIIILFTNLMGALLYYFVRRPTRLSLA